MRSRIPNLPFPHEVDVIRMVEGDDGDGGIGLSDAPTPVISGWNCRITIMSDEDEQEGFGNVTGRRWKVIGDWAPNIERSDFLRVPWGTFPNIEGAGGLSAGVPPRITLLRDGVPQTDLEWDYTAQEYVNGGDQSISWDGSNWVLTDTLNGDSFTWPDTIEEHHNFLNYPEAAVSDGGATYELTGTGDSQDYRVTYTKPQIDDLGDDHHTSLAIELEEADNGE